MGEEHGAFLSTLWAASQPPNKVGFHLVGRAYVPPNETMLGSIWLFVLDASRIDVTWKLIQDEGYWWVSAASIGSESTSFSNRRCPYTVANATSMAHPSPIITEITEILLDSPQHNAWTNFAIYSDNAHTYEFLVAETNSLWHGIFTFPHASNDRMVSPVVRTIFNRLKEALCLPPPALTGASRSARSLGSQRRQRQLLKKEKPGSDVIKAASRGDMRLEDIQRWSSRAVILDEEIATWRVAYWDTKNVEWTQDIDWRDELAFVLRALHVLPHSKPIDLPANILAVTLDMHDSSHAIHALTRKFAMAPGGDSRSPNGSSSNTSASHAAAQELAMEPRGPAQDRYTIGDATQAIERDDPELPAPDPDHAGNDVPDKSAEGQVDVAGSGHEDDKTTTASESSGAVTAVRLTEDISGNASKMMVTQCVQEEREARLHSTGPLPPATGSRISAPPSQSASRPRQRLTPSRTAENASAYASSFDSATKGPSHGVLGHKVASPSPPQPKAKRIKPATDMSEEEPDVVKLYTTHSASDDDDVQQPEVRRRDVNKEDDDTSDEDSDDAESEEYHSD